MTEERLKKRIAVSAVLLMAALIILVIISLLSGSASIEASDVLGALAGRTLGSRNSLIVLRLRLPRILAAVLLGGGLSVSGFLLQTFFRNPIAGPYVLGISSGAKLAVACILITFLSRGVFIGSAVLVMAAFAGSMAVMLAVLYISTKVSGMSVLIVCGVMMGYICSAATEFLITFADDSSIVDLHSWSMGSLSGIGMTNVGTAAVFIIPAVAVSICIAKQMWAFLIGEDYARSVGVDVFKLKAVLIIISSVLSGVTTAFAGPISFVGISVPHLVRSVLKTSRPIVIIPITFLGGAVFCMFCDLIARSLFAPTEVSISAVTAVFGAPVVIGMLIHRRNTDQ